ncbi:MAG: AfsR/SARP family transcriptional regulator [Bacillota bacterium]
MKLYITTLGDFDMLIEGKSIMQDASRSYKLFKLLEYFLTFKNKKLLPEVIIENLWQDQDSMDPKNMIRGQIFRLRQILKDILPGDDYLTITFSSGYYTLEVGEHVVLDTDEMEKWIEKGDQEVEMDQEKAMFAYRQAIDLYRGGYLSENHYEIWLVPIRSYYKRVYVKTIEKLVDLCSEKGRDEEIVRFSEKAVTIEPYEEKLHKYLIESLLRLGRIQNAHNHLEFMQVAFEKEMGITTTSLMRELERKIQSYSTEKGELTEKDISTKLDESGMTGPLKCEAEYFKLLYNSHKRRRKSDQEDDYISLITLKDSEEGNHDKWQYIIIRTLQDTLRKGDIFTLWNDFQILILLPEVKNGGIKSIEKRIRESIRNGNGNSFDMSFKFIPIENKTGLDFKNQ